MKKIFSDEARFSVPSLAGIVTVAIILAFIIGLFADDATWGQAISRRLKGILTNRGSTTNVPADLDYDSVEELYDSLRANYDGQLSENVLLDGLKKGLAEATGDPYTIYLNATEAKEFSAALNNEFSGIGAEIAIKDNLLTVVKPLDNTPARRAGLLPGDIIAEIDGVSSEGLFVEQAVAKIKGEAGTQVTLKIIRPTETKDFTITREKINIPNSEGSIMEGNIGYLKINTFGDSAVAQAKELASQFKKANVRGIVLDLRGNGGGLLDSAVDVAGLWLDNAKVVEQKGKQSATLYSTGRGPLIGIPTVVLVNGASASASEIVAGALQDHGAATLLGEQSFGKGVVQSLEELSSGGQLKVTIARWYTPNGKNIDQEGVKPDIEVKLSADDFNHNRDPQFDAAVSRLR